MISNEKLDKLAEEYTNGVRFFNLSTDCPPIEVLVENAYKSGYRACEKDAEELAICLDKLVEEMQVFLNVSLKIHFPDAREAQEKSKAALSKWRERGV